MSPRPTPSSITDRHITLLSDTDTVQSEKSDMYITVIYHAMFLTVLYQYH
jgi:hypothetical protein